MTLAVLHPHLEGREIPAYVGMTWEVAGMTWAVLHPHLEVREIPACAGMTWECAGMTWECVGMTRPGGNDGESNLLRPGRNPCRKSKR